MAVWETFNPPFADYLGSGSHNHPLAETSPGTLCMYVVNRSKQVGSFELVCCFIH
jgi:hypothetical protein